MWRAPLYALLLIVAVPAQAGILNVLVVDRDGSPVEGAVVFVESEQLRARVKPLEHVELAQKNKTFVPRQLLVTRGTAVEFPNRDEVRHHVYSFSPAKPFELKLYIGKPEAPIVFDKPGIVELGCNIHDHMLGWVIVADTPVYGQTDASGRYSAAALPADRYEVKVWHESLPYGSGAIPRVVQLDEGQTADLSITLEAAAP